MQAKALNLFTEATSRAEAAFLFSQAIITHYYAFLHHYYVIITHYYTITMSLLHNITSLLRYYNEL